MSQYSLELACTWPPGNVIHTHRTCILSPGNLTPCAFFPSPYFSLQMSSRGIQCLCIQAGWGCVRVRTSLHLSSLLHVFCPVSISPFVCRLSSPKIRLCLHLSLKSHWLIYWTSDINVTHRDPQRDLFMCNEFRAEVWCRQKRGKFQSSKGLKAQEMDTNVWSSLWPEGFILS